MGSDERDRLALWREHRPLVVAHRGASARAPANSLEALELAADAGADAVEIDVRRTSDGRLVAHHDARLARSRIARSPLEALRELAARLGRPLPTLAEVVEAVGDRVHLNVEIKDPGAAEPALDLLLDRARPASLLLSSFHAEVLETIRERAPAVPTGLLMGPHQLYGLLFRRGIPTRLRRRAEPADVLLPHRYSLATRLVGRLQRLDAPVVIWTVNSDRGLRKALRHPLLSGVITDRPARAIHARGLVQGISAPMRDVEPTPPSLA